MTGIRHGGVDDIAAVLDFWRRATAAASPTDDADALHVLLIRQSDALLLAMTDERIVGTLICTFDGWRAAMYRLAVDPSARRRRIATALVDTAERQLCAAGARRCHVIVMADEEPARSFWTAAGYADHGDQRRYVKNLAVTAG